MLLNLVDDVSSCTGENW